MSDQVFCLTMLYFYGFGILTFFNTCILLSLLLNVSWQCYGSVIKCVQSNERFKHLLYVRFTIYYYLYRVLLLHYITCLKWQHRLLDVATLNQKMDWNLNFLQYIRIKSFISIPWIENLFILPIATETKIAK